MIVRTDTREQIRAVAIELFSTLGFEKTSLREIAERLGFSKAALYYHFKSKNELAQSIVYPMKNDIDALIEEGTQGAIQPRDFFIRFFNIYYVHQDVFHILLRDASVLTAVDLEVWSREWLKASETILVGNTPTPEQRVRVLSAMAGLSRAVVLVTSLPVDVVRSAAVDAACGALGVAGPAGC